MKVKMLKFIILCMPEVRDSTLVNSLYKDAMDKLATYYPQNTFIQLDKFPETHCGAQEIRLDISRYVKLNQPTVIVTKFDFAANEMGNQIDLGNISHNEVLVQLLIYDEYNQPLVKEFQFESEGFMPDGWPYGILG